MIGCRLVACAAGSVFIHRVRQYTARDQWLRPITARCVRLGVVLALVLGLAGFVDLGAAAATLLGADAAPVALALVLVQLQIVLSALRWRLTARRVGQTIAAGRAIAEYYAATLLNALLPGGVSGDVIRTWRNRRDDATGDWQAPARAVILERAAGQCVFVAIAAVALALWPWLGPAPLPIATTAVIWAALGLFVALVLAALLGARVLPRRLAAFCRGFAPDARRAFVADGVWRAQLALSGAIVGSYLLVFALCTHAVGAPLSASAVVTLVPIVLATMLVPVSVAGWGVREAAAAALWPLVGATAVDGVAASVLYGLVCLVGALPGLLLVARRPPG